MKRPVSLSRRIAVGLLGYAALLGVAVLLYGVVIHEFAERMVLRSLLNAELDYIIEQHARSPDFAWSDTEALELHVFDRASTPDEPFAHLPPGLNDELQINGRVFAVNVRDVGDRRFVLALDVSDLEIRERELAAVILVSAVLLVMLTVLVVAWGARRLVRPFSELARRIAALDPEAPGHDLAAPAGATTELTVIVDALVAYLRRSEDFVERERTFINSVSHELRTPCAIVSGAAELGLSQPGVPETTAVQLRRILQTVGGIEPLIKLLLVLARTPERVASMSERVELDRLLPEIVADHRHLCRDKDLDIRLGPLPRCDIVAPLIIVQAAIGNLLRNAIEHSDRGEIRVSLVPGPEVIIEDPGHGMSPEEISQLYGRLARGESGDQRAGIGLDLIARLCTHLGWSLEIEHGNAGGTRVRLAFTRAVAGPGRSPRDPGTRA